MAIGDVLRVGDLTLPDGVVADSDPESAIAIAVGARTQVLEQESEEGAVSEPVVDGEAPQAAADGAGESSDS